MSNTGLDILAMIFFGVMAGMSLFGALTGHPIWAAAFLGSAATIAISELIAIRINTERKP